MEKPQKSYRSRQSDTDKKKRDITEENKQNPKMTVADRSVKKKNKTNNVVSFPVEIIEDIISRLPVKSILQSRSVSKPWLSLISTPSFNKLQFTHATESHHTGLFISAFDVSTSTRYYLTAAKHGGPLTILMTVERDTACRGFEISVTSHLKGGLVGFTSFTFGPNWSSIDARAFVVNPSTRKFFKLPDMENYGSNVDLCGYLYGVDESRKEYKVLFIGEVIRIPTMTYEFMIFSMASYSWRKIDAMLPVGFDWKHLPYCLGGVVGVSVNGVVHLMHNSMLDAILAFDFATEKFEAISVPQGFLPADEEEEEEEVGERTVYSPCITKINGCLGVVIHDRKRSEVWIWLLKDYDKRVWVKETIKFPKCWNDLLGRIPPRVDVNMEGEIVFSLSKGNENVIAIPIYNMKSKCFRSVEFTLDDQFASSKTVNFCHISCYVETITPLKDNWSKISHGLSD